MKKVTKLLIAGALATNLAAPAIAQDNNPFTNQANVCETGQLVMQVAPATLMVGLLTSEFIWNPGDYNAWKDVSDKIKRFNEIPTDVADQTAALSYYNSSQETASAERVSAKLKALKEEKAILLWDLIKQAKSNQTTMSDVEMEKLLSERAEKADKTAARSRLSRKVVFGATGVVVGLGLLTIFMDQEVADVLNRINDRSDLDRQSPEFKRSISEMFSGLGECLFRSRK